MSEPQNINARIDCMATLLHNHVVATGAKITQVLLNLWLELFYLNSRHPTGAASNAAGAFTCYLSSSRCFTIAQFLTYLEIIVNEKAK